MYNKTIIELSFCMGYKLGKDIYEEVKAAWFTYNQNRIRNM